MDDEPLRIAFAGYVFAPTGYGAAARSYVHALHSTSMDLCVVNRSTHRQHLVPDPLVTSLLDREIKPQLYLCNTEPPDVLSMSAIHSRLVVLTTWESDTLPPRFVDALNRVLEVWVPSRYNAETFRKQLKTPVFQLPHAVHAPYPLHISRDDLNAGLNLKDTDYVFLSVGTWQERKNLTGVIEAFLRAFPNQPNVLLVLKTAYSFVDKSVATQQIYEAIRRADSDHNCEVASRIRLCDKFWPEEMVTALMERADCYVSLHHGEGWCYPLFDAACNGTPVIATAYSGPMDYLDARYHHLVDYQLIPPDLKQEVDWIPFTEEMQWASPDLIHAASLMRSVYEHKAESTEKARAGANHLRLKYSFSAVGQMAQRRLAELVQSFTDPK
jgi:glycosyltransferase involved in cell wall biosynthesis